MNTNNFDTNSIDHLKSFIINIFDGCSHAGNIITVTEEDLEVINKIKETKYKHE